MRVYMQCLGTRKDRWTEGQFLLSWTCHLVQFKVSHKCQNNTMVDSIKQKCKRKDANLDRETSGKASFKKEWWSWHLKKDWVLTKENRLAKLKVSKWANPRKHGSAVHYEAWEVDGGQTTGALLGRRVKDLGLCSKNTRNHWYISSVDWCAQFFGSASSL